MVNSELLGHVKELLAPDEVIGLMISENRYGGASLFAPATVFATNKRIIVAKHGLFKLRKSFKIIKYSYITDIKLVRGIRFCKIHFGLQGEQVEEEIRKWISGLQYADALSLIHFINQIDSKIGTQQITKKGGVLNEKIDESGPEEELAIG